MSEKLTFPVLDPEIIPKFKKIGEWSLPKLYKRDKKNSLIFWQIGFDGKNLLTRSGMVGGKIKGGEVKVRRKNKDSYRENAWYEAKTKFNDKKLKNGYVENKAEATLSRDVMLCNKYDKKIWDKYDDIGLQPKLDGVRIRIRLENGEPVLITRKNKILVTLNHIKKDAKKLLKLLPPGSELDGEAYWHGKIFQDWAGLIRRTKNPSKREVNIKYYIYDFIPMEDEIPYRKRVKILEKLYEGIYDSNIIQIEDGLSFRPLMLLTYVKVNNHKQVREYHEVYKSLGFEGTIVRLLDKPYTHGRCNWILKHKDFVDREFPIIDVLMGEGSKKGCAIFVCERNGNQFTASTDGTVERARKMYKDRKLLIGKFVTVRYQEKTKKGIPRFGVAKAIRDYEI